MVAAQLFRRWTWCLCKVINCPCLPSIESASGLLTPKNATASSDKTTMRSNLLLAILSCVASISAHGAMTSGFGDFNPASRAKGFGIVDSTPRNGATREPFQVDTSIIRDRDMATAGVCGKTLAGGPNDVTAGMKAAEASGNVAQVRASTGVVTMTIHQVNADGKGPYTCMYSGDGTTFESMTVITDVPSEGRATATDFPLIAKLPSGVQPGAGMVRCRNNARAGPFGGCMAVVVMAA